MSTTWTLNYNNPSQDFLCLFDSEQDYVDAMFILLIWHNFGTLLDTEQLCNLSS